MYLEQKSYDGKVRLIDVTSKEFIQNPYKYYRDRREVGDLIEVHEGFYSTMAFTWADQTLRSRDMGKEEQAYMEEEEFDQLLEANPVIRIIRNWMLFKNPPEHTILRKLVSSAFTPRMVNEMEDQIRVLLQNRLDGIDTSQPFNFIAEIAYPFPVSVICHMLGLPEDDIPRFRRWSQDFAMALAVDVSALPEPQRNQLNQSAVELTQYFEKLLQRKREQLSNEEPNDLLSELLVVQEDGESLTTEELLATAILLLVAGHETTTNLLGNGLHALLTHPDQLELMKNDLGLIPNAVEEILRFDPPVQSVGRAVLKDTIINGRQFSKGEHITVSIGGANRDPRANSNPEQFDITRESINHLTFSKGIHYCIGAPLARLEAKIAFEELFSRYSEITLVETPKFGKNWLLRGYSELMIELRE